MYGDLEEMIANTLRNKLMSRRQIQDFAKKWADKNHLEFTASNGWY